MAAHGGLPLLLLLISLVCLVLVFLKKRPKWKLPPGPPRLPLIGNLHQLLLGRNQHRTLWELSKRYGPLMHLQLGRISAVVISSAQMAEEFCRTHDLKFCSRPSFTSWKRLAYDYKDVALSPYGATWRDQRKIMVLYLLGTRKVERIQSIRKEEVERVMSLISSMSVLSEPINLSNLLHSLANDILCRAVFSETFRSEGQGLDDNQFSRSLKETQALIAAFFAADHLPWAGWVDVLAGQRARLEKNFAELDAFFQEAIKVHADPMRSPKYEEDVLDMLLGLQRKDADLTDDHIKGLLLDIFSAGTDTSSAAMVYAMAELVRNPSTLAKAQQEVRDVVGKKGKVEEGDLGQLNYLKCVVKETLRLHPPIPLNPRETLSHINIGDYDIPPKTRVIINMWAIGRDTASWKDPDDFIPERFMNSAMDFRGRNYQFIPFGAGRRICPGMVYGLAMVELALANLLYTFDWEAPNEKGAKGIDMEDGVGIAVPLKNDLHLKATKYLY